MDNKEINNWVLAGGLALLIMWAFKMLKYILFFLVFIISFGYFRYSERKKRQSKYYEI
jgi:hypothetical protein